MATNRKAIAKLSAAESHNLSELVDYAKGAIVSKTLAENESGTITLFAFDVDQGLSEHTAPFDAFVQILDGKAEVVIAGNSVKAQAGQIVLMPANIPHALKALEPFKMLLTMLRSRKAP